MGANTAEEQLRIEVERIALQEIAREFDNLNWNRFRNVLRRPQFRLIESAALLGRWTSEGRCIDIARSLVFEQPWGAVVEVLLHEMAHQYVDEYLGANDSRPHGELFAEVCRRAGIDARTRGIPEMPADAARSAILEKISKLLALATSPNPHEAQSAMNAARRLMLKHNIERAEREQASGFVWRQLGRPVKRVEIHRTLAGCILEEHFFVQAIWISAWDARTATRGRVLEVCGSPANVEFAEYVYSFLVHTAEGLWAANKRGASARGGLSARRSFLRGVLGGFDEKLRLESRREQEDGLVWVGDPALDAYFRQRNPHVVRRASRGRHDAEAHARGHEAGKKLVLHKAVDSGTGERGMQLNAKNG